MFERKKEELNLYYRDIEIAQTAIRDSLLYPNGEILYDLYAIPSHNHQAFYAIIYRKDSHFEIVYAKTEIHSTKFEEPVRMYTFHTAKKASTKSHSDGRIIVGLAKPDDEFIKMLMDTVSSVREICKNDKGIVLDGVLQAIRVFENGEIDKEIIYHDKDDILLSDDPTSKDFLDNMYLYVERMITKV